jgi:hypothetical protein
MNVNCDFEIQSNNVNIVKFLAIFSEKKILKFLWI